MRRRTLTLVLILGPFAAGCGTTRAAAPIERPTLDVPPAPPRIVRAEPVVELTEPEPVPDLPAPTAPPAARPRASSPRELTPRDTQKPDLKADTAAADPAASPPVVVPAAPLLRTPATVDSAAAERHIRDTVARAQKGLKAVDYQRLTELRQKAYNEAKDFISGAEAAIKASNFELAKELAEKAEKYARELQAR